MRAFLPVSTILLSLAASSLAAKCDASTATIFEVPNPGDSTNTSDPTDVPGGLDGSGLLTDLFSGTSSPFSGTDDSYNEFSKRQAESIECVGNEVCYGVAGILLCVDLETGDFHDVNGGVGNVLTSTYTAGSGSPSGNSGSSGTSSGTTPGSTGSNTGSVTGSGSGSGSGSTSTSGVSGSTISQPSAAENAPSAGSVLEISMAKAVGVTLLAGLLQRALLH